MLQAQLRDHAQAKTERDATVQSLQLELQEWQSRAALSEARADALIRILSFSLPGSWRQPSLRQLLKS